MQENNSQTTLQISWLSKNQKNFVYKLNSKTVVGLGVSFDGDNYRNWKKLLYNIDQFSSSTEIKIDTAVVNPAEFFKTIKLFSPRPLDKNFESYSCSTVCKSIYELNCIKSPVDHPLLLSTQEQLWKNLPTYKKVMLQILCSIDVTKKTNFIFLEKMTFPEQHQSFIAETLKYVVTKYDITVVLLGQNKILPQIRWLPLLPAPVDKRQFLPLHDEEEDYDEAVS